MLKSFLCVARQNEELILKRQEETERKFNAYLQTPNKKRAEQQTKKFWERQKIDGYCIQGRSQPDSLVWLFKLFHVYRP